MKKIVLTFVIFAIFANLSAQIKVNSLGYVGIGCIPTDDAFRIRNTTVPSFAFEGINTRLQIGVALNNGWFAPYAQTGDIVYRQLGAKGMIFNLSSSHNDGKFYIKFGDDLHGGWISILNNK
jgi:hypothetical protein